VGLHEVPDAAVQVALVLWRCVRRLFGVWLHACTISLPVGTVVSLSLRVGEAIDEAGGNGEAQGIILNEVKPHEGAMTIHARTIDGACM
jgi:hypothetical protein